MLTFCCTANRVSSVYTYLPFSFGFPSHLGHHRAWSRVPCAVQQVLLSFSILYTMGFPSGSVGKESACNLQDTQVRSLGREDALEEGMTTYSSILAWRVPWTEEPRGLQSMGSQRVHHDILYYTKCRYICPNLPVPPTPSSFLGIMDLFFMSVCLFLLCR